VNFSAIIRQVGQVSVVEVTGKLTSFESAALRTSIAKLLKEGRKQILLNLSGLVYLDSSGIADLVHTYMSVIKSGGEMKVVGLTDKVEEILKITQLYQVFQEFKDERSALQSFSGDGSKRKTVAGDCPAQQKLTAQKKRSS
jgi:anti-sigma B factor antagonist